ncbi:MAG: class I SAM-dependent methyltransferase [Euryarchaeota archaeon]|nr:class I SAM-dependent methyltransferase [Euryarchaeota archaeon]
MQDNTRTKTERKFWGKNASGYDRSIIEKYWKIYPSLLDKIAQDVGTGGAVLEVATGTGLVALEIASAAEQVHAIDISPQMIDEAKKKVEVGGIDNVAFSVEDAYALPFGDGMFDTVVCNNALHNMKHPEDALSEIRRVLKPDGRFIAVIAGVGESLKFKIALTISTLVGQLPVFHKLNLDEFADFIDKSGFTVATKDRLKHPKDRMALLYVNSKKEE